MLEAIAIFLLFLAALSGLVTYISAHNNPLKLPDLSKPGSFFTISLLVGGITVGLWPSMTVYGDCSDLAADALTVRADLFEFELVDNGGAAKEMKVIPSDRMLNYFKDNEVCFEIPEERIFRRVSFADLEEEELATAQETVAKYGDHLGLLEAANTGKIDLSKLFKEVSNRHEALWEKETIPETEESIRPISEAELEAKLEEMPSRYRAQRKEKDKVKKAWEAKKAEWDARLEALEADFMPLLTWSKDLKIVINPRQGMLVPSETACEPEVLKKDRDRTINRKNSKFSDAEKEAGVQMEAQTFSALVAGPEDTQGVIYLEAIKDVQKLGRNADKEVDFGQYPQVRDVIFRTLMAEDIEGAYTGDLAPQQAVAYAQTAAEAELTCFLTSKTARDACNQISTSCDTAKSTGGLSEDDIDSMMDECLTKRTTCYNEEQESKDDPDADIPESCVEADAICNDTAVAACTEATKSCGIESVTETVEETGLRCKGRVHAEVKRQCYADQTATVEEESDKEDEEGEEEEG